MKKAFFTLLTICFYATAFGQTPDAIRKPTFNSKLISDELVGDFELITKYYTIQNNISNRNSTVYVNDKPTIEEYTKFALTQPPYLFVVHQGAFVKLEITLTQKKEGDVTTFSYVIVNPGTGNRLEVPSRVLGVISEARVTELNNLKLDLHSKIMSLPQGEVFSFNGMTYTIQSFEEIKKEIKGFTKSIMSGMASAKQ